MKKIPLVVEIFLAIEIWSFNSSENESGFQNLSMSPCIHTSCCNVEEFATSTYLSASHCDSLLPWKWRQQVSPEHTEPSMSVQCPDHILN